MGRSMRNQSARARVALAAACVAFTFVYLTTAIFFRNNFLGDPDTFLHISVGNLILQNGRFPVVDQFSYTAFGKPWFATDWIPELIFASLYKVEPVARRHRNRCGYCRPYIGVLCLYLAMKLRLAIALGACCDHCRPDQPALSCSAGYLIISVIVGLDYAHSRSRRPK